MSDSNPTPRELLWTHLNLLGRFVTILVMAFTLSILLSIVLPWEPFRSIRNREPSVGDYIATTLLLMIDVPLGWAAWKALKTDVARRWVVVIYLAMIFFTLLEIRIALEKGERWYSRTEMIFLVTLVIAQQGIGRRKRLIPVPVSERSRVGSGL